MDGNLDVRYGVRWYIIILWHLRFSQRFVFSLHSSEMWSLVAWQTDTKVLETPAVSVIRRTREGELPLNSWMLFTQPQSMQIIISEATRSVGHNIPTFPIDPSGVNNFSPPRKTTLSPEIMSQHSYVLFRIAAVQLMPGNRTLWSRSNALHLYVGDAQCDAPPGHRLPWLGFKVGFFSSSKQTLGQYRN
jgi:hypothetical protein